MAPAQSDESNEKEQSPIQELLQGSIPSPRPIGASLAHRPHVASTLGPIQPPSRRQNATHNPPAGYAQQLRAGPSVMEPAVVSQMIQHNESMPARYAQGRDNSCSVNQPNENATIEGRQNATLTFNHRTDSVVGQSNLNAQAAEFRPAATHVVPGGNAVRTSTRYRQTLGPAQRPSQGETSQSRNPQGGRRFVPNPAAREFVPTTMALLGPGVQRAPTTAEQARMLQSGMSANYRGDPGNRFNHSADIPDEDNTSFWITRLNPNVHESEILAPISGCGRVYQLHINREQVQLGKAEDAAAKLTFFTKPEATRFSSQYMVGQRLIVNGRRAYIRHNRNRVGEQWGLGPHVTRCLLAEGPRHLLEPTFLLPYLASLITYRLDQVFFDSTGDDDMAPSKVLIRFASYRGQAALAWRIFRQNAIFRNAGVRVQNDRDPCDV